MLRLRKWHSYLDPMVEFAKCSARCLTIRPAISCEFVIQTSLACFCRTDDQRGKPLASNVIKPYEVVYIIRPNLDEDAVDRVVLAVEEFIKGTGATIETTDKKGRRRLAYEVDKMRDGYFVLTIFHAKPDAILGIKRMMTLSEDIIRSLIVIHEKESAKTL